MPQVAPVEALALVAKHWHGALCESEAGYKQRRDDPKSKLTAEDVARERIVLALVSLFVESPRLAGFQGLVPRVFDVYLEKGTTMRAQLGRVLAAGGAMEKTTIERIATDDELVRQPLFWSVAGMSLFSGGEQLRDPKVLEDLLAPAVREQPSIVAAFLEDQLTKVRADPALEAHLGSLMKVGLRVLLKHAEAAGVPATRRALNLTTEIVLKASARHYAHVYAPVLEAWGSSHLSASVLDGFVGDFRPRLDRGWVAGDDSDEVMQQHAAAVTRLLHDRYTG